MVDENVDNAILAISMVAAFLALGLFAAGNILALSPLLVSILGFVYLTIGVEQIDQWLSSFSSQNEISTDSDNEALGLL